MKIGGGETLGSWTRLGETCAVAGVVSSDALLAKAAVLDVGASPKATTRISSLILLTSAKAPRGIGSKQKGAKAPKVRTASIVSRPRW